MVAVLGAPERRGRLRRRRRELEGDPVPAPVTTGRATLVEAGAPFGSEEEARRRAREAGETEARRGLRVLNDVLHAHRLATRDPTVHEVGLEQAIAVRLGWTEGDAAAAGRLTGGVEVPVPQGEARGPGRRATALRPQEHLAALLARRAAPLAAESLALRAREDLEAGRPREAALQLVPALDAALAELGAEGDAGGLAPRLEELRGLSDAVHRQGAAVLEGGETDPAALDHALGRLEALLRARAAGLT